MQLNAIIISVLFFFFKLMVTFKDEKQSSEGPADRVTSDVSYQWTINGPYSWLNQISWCSKKLSTDRLCPILEPRQLICIRAKTASRPSDPWHSPLCRACKTPLWWERPWIYPTLALEKILESLCVDPLIGQITEVKARKVSTKRYTVSQQN